MRAVNMKMTNRLPSNWKELQNLVAKYFNEAGYIAETPYEIELVRGKKEVDVFVKAPNELGKEIIIECKYWDTNIPQNEIHALRTVVNDAGVSLGIIISKVGFQEGAFKAIVKSNVELKTWDEFLEMIFDKWLLERMKSLKIKRSPLAVYLDPLDVPAEQLSKEQKEKYLKKVLEYARMDGEVMFMRKEIFWEKGTKCKLLTAFDNIEDYFEYLSSEIEKAIECFESIFKDIEIPQEKFQMSDNYLFWNI